VKKLLIPLVILLVLSFIAAGCSSSPTTTTAPPTTQPTTAAPTTSAPATTTAAPTTTAKPTTSAPATTTTAPSTTPSTPAGVKRGGTLTWIATSGPAGAIGWPPEVTGPNGVTPQISEQPLLKEMLDGSMVGNLAASFDVDTGTADPSLTLHLQKGVKFHDGTDFNAAAVKWNLDLIKSTPYYLSSTANWKSIEVVDDYTVKVHFTAWQNTLVRNFGDTMTYQVSPTAFTKYGIDYMRLNMVGTGPFVQSNYQRDVTLQGVRNNNYWEPGKPYLDSIKYLFVADELTATALYKSGGGDVLGISNLLTMTQLQAAGDNVVVQYLGPTSLFPDAANPDSPFANIKVRQALAYAIDNEAIAKTFGFGFWKAAYQFSTPASKAYDPTITGIHYDVAKAKQLLADAGYPNGFKTTIWASPIFLNKDVVLAIQANLKAVGIVADTQFPLFAQWSDMSTKAAPKNSIIYTSINEWGNQNATFNYFLGAPATVYPSALKPTGWKETLDASKATSAPDPVLLKKMENMINDNAMVIPIYYGTNNIAFKPYVMDSGQGTRGQSNWYEPQQTWLNK
jgi:peptide/nickel transport system substrate-binding protein